MTLSAEFSVISLLQKQFYTNARCANAGKPKPPETALPAEKIVVEKEAGVKEASVGDSLYSDDPLPTPVSSPRSIKPPLALVAVVAALISVYAFGAARNAQMQQQQTQQKSADELSDFKKQGFAQCSAGDVEGCHYYIDKLRDHGNAEDGEYLKARMIFAEFLNNSSAFGRDSGDFSRNEFSSERLKAVAEFAAVEGSRSAMDAAIYLADNPVPAGFPPLPPNEPRSAAQRQLAPPVAPTVAPFFSMKTKTGGGRTLP